MKKTLLFLLIAFLQTIVAIAQENLSDFKIDAKKKPALEYISYSTRTIAQLPGFSVNKPITTNVYGSRMDRKGKVTGFFHAELINGRWWIIDPEGYLSICRAVNDIKTGTGEDSKNAFATKFDNSSSVWMSKTMEYLDELGFNCAGAWSATTDIITNPRQLKKPLAYTINFNWMSGYAGKRINPGLGWAAYPNNVMFVFEKGFADYCDVKAQALAVNKSDKNLFGYFSDNELPFYLKSLNNYLRQGNISATDENYLAAAKWLSDNNYTLADTLNADVQARFLAYVGVKYFSVVNAAIKKYDPNHMYIGSRTNRMEAMNDKYFMQACGKHVDIMSFNYYNSWTPNSSYMSEWGKNLGKPFMVTEFYTKGEDSGLGNTSGGGWIVKTQLDRGFAYQHFTLALLESKYCVGWHWFKYMDNDPSSVSGGRSNVDGNKGILKINYEPYAPLVEKMKELNLKVYNLIDYFDKLTLNK